jgi:hypothetical protein
MHHARVKEGEFLKGCTLMVAHNWKNRISQEDHEGQEAKFLQRGYDQVMPELFRMTSGPDQRDYYTSANHVDLQGVKDP